MQSTTATSPTTDNPRGWHLRCKRWSPYANDNKTSQPYLPLQQRQMDRDTQASSKYNAVNLLRPSENSTCLWAQKRAGTDATPARLRKFTTTEQWHTQQIYEHLHIAVRVRCTTFREATPLRTPNKQQVFCVVAYPDDLFKCVLVHFHRGHGLLHVPQHHVQVLVV